MKYLSDYTNEAITEALNKHKGFFAFSDKQLQEAKKEHNISDDEKLISCGGGMLCPRDNARQLLEAIKKAHKQGIEQDIKENGLNAIIKRELNNHEAPYTRNTDSTKEALQAYEGITDEMIDEVFKSKEYQEEQAKNY